jgi:hypothetical protein
MAPMFALGGTILAARLPRAAVAAGALVLVLLAAYSAAGANLWPNTPLRTATGAHVRSFRQYAALVVFGSDAERFDQGLRRACSAYSAIPDGSVVVPAGATLLHAVVGSQLERRLADPIHEAATAAELADAVRTQGATWFVTFSTGSLARLAASDPARFESVPTTCGHAALWHLRDSLPQPVGQLGHR